MKSERRKNNKQTCQSVKAQESKKIFKKKASKEGLVLRFFNMDWIVLNTSPSLFYILLYRTIIDNNNQMLFLLLLFCRQGIQTN